MANHIAGSKSKHESHHLEELSQVFMLEKVALLSRVTLSTKVRELVPKFLRTKNTRNLQYVE